MPCSFYLPSIVLHSAEDAEQRSYDHGKAGMARNPSNVTPKRIARMYRMIKFLGTGRKTQSSLERHVKLIPRGFYRDLEKLREYGVSFELYENRYVLMEPVRRPSKSCRSRTRDSAFRRSSRLPEGRRLPTPSSRNGSRNCSPNSEKGEVGPLPFRRKT